MNMVTVTDCDGLNPGKFGSIIGIQKMLWMA